MNSSNLLSAEFCSLSARLGRDPLQVQGPGGNTSVKGGNLMWIKASGTELANADDQNIFVQVDCNLAKAEAMGDGKGDCLNALLDPVSELRPSIETTFHAILDYSVVAHTHSVMTLVHSISPQGRQKMAIKLAGLPYVIVPYVKPGLPLTREILKWIKPETQIIILQNHGLICCGPSVAEVERLIAIVEDRLFMPPGNIKTNPPTRQVDNDFYWSEYSWIAQKPHTFELVVKGSYYPDHVVFLGPALPSHDHAGSPPVIIKEGEGVLVKKTALPSQQAMLRCLAEIMQRMPVDWTPEPIGKQAEAELLNWDAEKYRQALAQGK